MRIVIIDDHPVVRKGLAAVFSLEEDMNVVGEAMNKEDGLKLLQVQQPDLALIDLRLAEDSGVELIREARIQGINCKFILLTSSASMEDVNQAKQVFVDGYILKEALPEELLYAIQLVMRGRKYYDPGLMEFNIQQPTHSLHEELTPKEKEVLIALGEGLSNKGVGNKLFISECTVKKHVSQILDKLELNDRTQAALYANAVGLVKYQIA